MVAQDCYKKFFALGFACLVAGLFVQHALPPMLNYYINKQISLSQGSLSYPKWESPPVPIYQKFYFYNVTNAAEIEQMGAKPLLEEIGPFTYRSHWQKQEMEHNALENTIKYKHFKQWHFEPDLSITDHSLQIVTLNAPLAVTLTLIQSASNAVRLLVTLSLDGLSEGFFTKRSVRQLLFEGYPDLLTTFGPLLNSEMLSQGGHFGYMNARNNTFDGAFEINTGADDIAKLNTIRKYNGRARLAHWSHHSHHGGHSSSPSSQHHHSTATPGGGGGGGQVSSSSVGNRCDSLEGASTGEMFPPIMSDNQTVLKLFQPDFCRVWRLNLDGKYEQAGTGLRLSRFKASRDIFRNSTDLPENVCYFKHHHHASRHHSTPAESNRVPADPAAAASTRHRPGHHSSANSSAGSDSSSASQPNQQSSANRQQQGPASNNNNNNNNVRPPATPAAGHTNKVRQEWPAGVFTLGPCKFNAPIYMSMPHFLDADPYFAGQVDGLAPDPLRHEFFVDLEPRTGSPVTLAARVQLNVAISKPPGLVRFRNIPEIMFPVFWQELTVNLTGTPVIDELLLASRAQQQTIRVGYVLYLLGAAILTTAALFCLHLKILAQAAAAAESAAASVATSVADSKQPLQ